MVNDMFGALRDALLGVDMHSEFDSLPFDYMIISVQRANARKTSIDEIMVRYEINDKTSDKIFLINPDSSSFKFQKYNGITPDKVKNSPTFPSVWNQIKEDLVKYPVFVFSANAHIDPLYACCEKYHLPEPVIPRIVDLYEITESVPAESHSLEDINDYLDLFFPEPRIPKYHLKALRDLTEWAYAKRKKSVMKIIKQK